MDTDQEYDPQEHTQNGDADYTGYKQHHPENSYHHIYEQANKQQQQEYKEQIYSGRNEQQYTPPMDSSYYRYQMPDIDSRKGNLPGTHGSFAAGLSYLGFWLTGLLFLIFERKNRLVRFHAMQSLLLFGGVSILYFFLLRIMIDQTPFIWGFATFAFVLMNIIAAVSWFVGLIGAFGGKYTKLPFVGDIAERYVNRTTPAGPRQV